MDNRYRRRGMFSRLGVPFRVTALGLGLAFAVPSPGQISLGGHEAHHPGQGQAGPGASQPAGPGAAGEVGEGMGEMMREMGAPPPKELYPSLMALPSDLPSEKRNELQQQAHERMTAGMELLSEGLEALSKSAARDDFPALEEATARLRQGLAQFESGLAAYRALAEGKVTRSVALEWFKREMNLATSVPEEAPHGLFGLSWFHYVTMFILLAFAGTMIWMSVQRMNRAGALLRNLTSGKQAVTAMPASSPQTRVAGTTPTAAAETPTPAPATAPTTYQVVVPTTLPAGHWSGQLRVALIFQETADVRTFRLTHPAEGDLPFVFEPGQFLTVSVTIEGKEAKRSYSIASSPCCRSWCEITVKQAPEGLVSGFLHERVKTGDLIGASGPYGKFSFRGTEAPDIVLIAGGVGITPLMSALRYLTDQSWAGEIFLIYACATMADVIFREELEYLIRRHPNLHVTFVLSQETSAAWTGPRGRITKDLLLQAVPDLRTRRVHLCGPPPMMEAVKTMLAEIGVPPDQVQTETFLGAEPRPSPPAGVPVSAMPPPAVAAALCTFVHSGKTAPLPPDKTVLEASEDVDVNIDYSCRQGYCGVCKTKLLSGQVTMAVEDGLMPEDKASGFILACQAKSTADVAVEA
ncbi:2Fe-2S iron-sulfur cluster-binding protein [Methylocaldum sp. 14B]|uniref:2Fe-2S iron-sulfur cluster-binding protein n=1 Tax=Methylocaldum sp. 14B TaxID=1912213 RepID=UPI00197C40F9|nr:2Fe-2S iron-sulfur cluster-binding protein [Methylocaldum sp. 14B]